MILKIKKKDNHYYFTRNHVELKTLNNNKIKIRDKKLAMRLLKYLTKCIKSKNKNKIFFLQILYFNFDLNNKNKKVLINKLINYLHTDLLCYRAEDNTELAKIQTRLWQPLINYAFKNYKIHLKSESGIMPIRQDSHNNIYLSKFLNKLNSIEFSTYFFITNFSNSNIIALNFMTNNIVSVKAWQCLSLEETYSQKKWGKDKEVQDKLLEKKKYFDEIINFNLLLTNQEICNERN
tara:strand:- start:162 stop:866 length:705 start_codon:yes stop_codon:yes gene_type:complete